MIERYLKLKSYVNSIVLTSADHSKKLKKYLLDKDEILIADYMLQILQPFKVITRMLSHSELTSSRILPCLVFLKQKLEPNQNSKADLEQMKSYMFKFLH